jgi:hypothetical protein
MHPVINKMFVVGILSLSNHAICAEEPALLVNGNDLSCSRYNGEEYFYVELNGKYQIPKTEFTHHFDSFLFSGSCAQVDSLKGSQHKVAVMLRSFPYNATICERGGSWYCHQHGCYGYRVEYVDLLFANGLKLSSEVHTPQDEARKIHDGQCSTAKHP